MISPENISDEFWNRLEPKFKSSEDQIWNNISNTINKSAPKKKITVRTLFYPIAASLLIIICSGLFIRFYTKTIHTSFAQTTKQTLPDDSIVSLSANTQLKYKPFWYSRSRSISLEGEAYFQVNKGKTFTVSSKLGETKVLGTSFNINTRNNTYEVYCETGRVQVSSATDNAISVVLSQNEYTNLEVMTKTTKANGSSDHFLDWKSDQFSFQNSTLLSVFQEIELRYNIKIDSHPSIDSLRISAYFKQPTDPKDALMIISNQFDLTFEQISANHYKLSQLEHSD